MITYGSVCSGIEAASIAWESLGFRPSWFAQFDPEHDYSRGPDFASAVLKHHWPHVANLGDMTLIADAVRYGFIEAPDVLVGGTPCQAFSVAGLRGGLSDGRGFLTLKFVELADAIDEQRISRGESECVIVWENVPGVLSSKDNAFGCFLAGLAGESEPIVAPGGKWSNAGYVSGPSRTVAWRILDAQYFGVAQRRRRVFVVASARKGFDPAAVLFESEGVRRDTAPSRESGKAVAALTANGVGTCGADDNQGQAGHLIPAVCMAHGQGGAEIKTDGSTPTLTCNHEAPIVVHGTQGPIVANDMAHCLGRNSGQENALCYSTSGAGFWREGIGALRAREHDSHENLTVRCVTGKGDAAPCVAILASGQESLTPWEQQGLRIQGDSGVAPTLMSNPAGGMKLEPIFAAMQVRRLTPTECERLQGFPDIKKTFTIPVINQANDNNSCLEHLKKSVIVGTKNRKSLRYALSVAQEKSQSLVKFALRDLKQDPVKLKEHVVVSVLIDLERLHLQLRSAGKLILSVSIAGDQSKSPLLIPVDDFVLIAALMTQEAEKITLTGKAVSLGKGIYSSHLQNGSLLSSIYGQEIRELVSDVILFTLVVKEHLKFITSQAGQNSLSSEQKLATLYYFVAAAISGFIPEQTVKSNSFDLNVTISHGYTNIIVGKKLSADGPRYKALGNSMAVPVMRWIGNRIILHTLGAI